MIMVMIMMMATMRTEEEEEFGRSSGGRGVDASTAAVVGGHDS